MAEEVSLNDAVAAHRAGDLAAAEAGYRKILSGLNNARAACNLGIILRQQGQLAEAERLMRQAILWTPEQAAFHYNLGNLLLGSRRLVEAVEEYRRAQALSPAFPGLTGVLADTLLTLGDFEEGWRLYDDRPDRANTPTRALSFPEWRGEPLEGKSIYIRTEQGFGDQIFIARYLSQLGAARVTLSCADSMGRLFSQFPVEIAPRHGPLSVERHDYWAVSMSLARWLPPPPRAPYLTAPQTTPRPGSFGVAWRGKSLPDPNRSLPSDVAAALLAMPGAISLQPEDSGAADFQETAGIVTGLDLVVSIDTSIAHLAGAMGKRGIVLLQHHSSDWRWREDPPGRSWWYPSLKILRQSAPGDWHSVLDEVTKARLTLS